VIRALFFKAGEKTLLCHDTESADWLRSQLGEDWTIEVPEDMDREIWRYDVLEALATSEKKEEVE